MINSQKVLYSPGKNDECYTPDYGVKPMTPLPLQVGVSYNRNTRNERLYPLLPVT